MVDKLAIDKLSCMDLIDEHIFTTIAEKGNFIVHYKTSVHIIDQRNITASSLENYKDTVKLTSETLYESDDEVKNIKMFTGLGDQKNVVLEHLFVSTYMITTKAHGFLYFDSDYKLSIRGCLLSTYMAENFLPPFPFLTPKSWRARS